jgi:hypothetical protein
VLPPDALISIVELAAAADPPWATGILPFHLRLCSTSAVPDTVPSGFVRVSDAASNPERSNARASDRKRNSGCRSGSSCWIKIVNQ